MRGRVTLGCWNFDDPTILITGGYFSTHDLATVHVLTLAQPHFNGKKRIPYSGKFSMGSYFRDFADCIRSRENKNRNNIFQY